MKTKGDSLVPPSAPVSAKGSTVRWDSLLWLSILLLWYLWYPFSFVDICHSILLACGTVRRLRTCWTGTPWWKSITQLWKVTLERIRRRVEEYIWGLLTRSLSWLCMKIASLDETLYMISFVPFRWSHNGLVIDETRFF